MDHKNRMIFVAGATGNQGGAVARHLLDAGWRVRGLTRDVSKPASKALERLGAEMVDGDMDHRDELTRLMDGCHGAFSVQNTWTSGVEGEIKQGKNMAEAAKAAGVRHFVYSSVGGAERNTGLPHFDSKWEVEKYLREIKLDQATVLRPVWFMDNFASEYFMPGIMDGELRMGMKPDRRLQMIAVDDIGALAAKAFDEADSFTGRAIEIAGDELTLPEIAMAIGKAVGYDVDFIQVTPQEEEKAFGRDWAAMTRWFNEQGYKADIPRLRQIYPALMNFRTWLPQSELAKARQKMSR